MAEEKKWKKWEGPGTPEGKGGTSATAPNEVEGRSRQFVAVCFNCGAQSYVGVDWKWYTCWKCGGTSSEMVA